MMVLSRILKLVLAGLRIVSLNNYHEQIAFAHYRILLYALHDDGRLVGWEPPLALANSVVASTLAQSKIDTVPFYRALRKYLKDVQIDAGKHSREKFLSDLRLIRTNYEGDELKSMLDKIRTRLENPEILEVTSVQNMLLSYRDIQEYGSMIQLVEDLMKVKCTSVTDAPPIRFMYAFALNRRNLNGDRNKALEVVLDVLKMPEMSEAPDTLCLAGRICKDKFADSNYTGKCTALIILIEPLCRRPLARSGDRVVQEGVRTQSNTVFGH
jgi:mitogen-activated protein kinase kinase kinase 5